MTLRLRWTACLLAAALCAPIGCGNDDDDGHGDHDHTTDEEGKGTGKDGGRADSGSKPSGDDGLEVAGEWSGEFGDETIRDDEWAGTPIVEFDNEKNVAYTQNADDAMFDPGKFNKLVWTEPTDEGFFYCTVDFGLDSLDDAKDSTKTADVKNPEEMGSCGGFAFTKLEAK